LKQRRKRGENRGDRAEIERRTKGAIGRSREGKKLKGTRSTGLLDHGVDLVIIFHIQLRKGTEKVVITNRRQKEQKGETNRRKGEDKKNRGRRDKNRERRKDVLVLAFGLG
jgi:hypothetical protein